MCFLTSLRGFWRLELGNNLVGVSDLLLVFQYSNNQALYFMKSEAAKKLADIAH